MYTLSNRERRAKSRRVRPVLLEITVELMGKCQHIQYKLPVACDCNEWSLSPRSQLLLQLGLAKIKYVDIDLSFL
jgi:hypothetical protein